MCFTPEFAKARKKVKAIEWYESDDVWGQSNMVYCHILDRGYGDDGGERYKVELIFFEFRGGKPLTEKDLTYDPSKPDEERYIDYNVPRRAIKWNEKPYNDDEHLPNAFRHPIGFPDDLWPQAWTKQ